ncbi:MAG: hypothetical protein HRT73_00370 [Flavobacteriales bacterium]|nr:hypothetical protein [Flavobacteriales bacterium]NQX96323.1 hypothetical protein [Flavobacteriales bacterium]
MQNNIDYIISEKARTMGNMGGSGMKIGTMIGTKNYFFFFPDKIEDGTNGILERKMRITTTISFEGLSMKEYIKTKVEEDRTSIEDFEAFALAMSTENEYILAYPFSDIKQVKLKVNFFAGTITVNKTDKKMGGWDIIFSSLGKQKKDVKEFYRINPII